MLCTTAINTSNTIRAIDGNCCKAERNVAVAVLVNSFTDRVSGEGSAIGRVRPSVTFEPTDLRPWFLRVYGSWPQSLEGLKVKIIQVKISWSRLARKVTRTVWPRVQFVFTARCYASAVLAMALCLSVCPPVCPSQVGVLLKRLNRGSQKQHHTIPQRL